MGSGQNSSEGAYRIQVPGFDVTLSGAFSTAEKYLGGTGIWKRTGDYTFSFAVMFVAVDSEGNSIWTGKLAGIDTLSADCDSMWIEAELEIFLPWQNPFADDSFFDPVILDPHAGYRMTLDSASTD
jgi:hypothetical protein